MDTEAKKSYFSLIRPIDGRRSDDSRPIEINIVVDKDNR